MAAVGALTLYRSTIGKKVIMAISGLIGLGFVFFHMYGNLKVYQGAAVFNHYAEGLRTIGDPVFGYSHLLWIARLALIGAVVAHVVAAIQLTRIDWHGRPSGYRKKKLIHTSYAARTMRLGGAVIFAFIVYHLLDLTFGVVNPGFVGGDVYRNFIATFRNPIVAAFYVIANILLGLHIYHGGWSLWQTLGLNDYRWSPLFRGLATVLALAVTLGNISFPIAVQTGFLR
ncbi:MAG: succinate dehydrogenase cytochrome b subunit [Dehalococcoidia bacterium]